MQVHDFRQLLRRTVAVPVLLLVALAFVLTSQVEYVVVTLRRVEHRDRVISQSRLLMRIILDMETGLRGYLLTGDKQFLEPYNASAPTVAETLKDLKAAVSDEPAAVQQLQQLASTFDDWRAYSRDMISARARIGDLTDVEVNVAGKQMMDEIRQHQDRFVQMQEQKRDSESATARRATRIILPVVGFITIAVGLLSASATRRSMLALSASYEKHMQLEARRAEELRRSREWLFTTLRSLGEAVIATDAAGNIEFMNPVAERLTGFGESDARGHSLDSVFQTFDERTHEAVLAADFLAAAEQGAFTNHTILRSRDGRESYIDRTATPIMDGDGKTRGSVVVFRDQTDRKRSEDALRSSERLALIGRLSATIAHEIRNPLDAVTNLLYLVRHSHGVPQEMLRNVEIAQEELDRIAQITRQLLSFNRESKSPVPVDVAEVMDSVLALFRAKLLSAHINVDTDYLAHPIIKGFPGELRQVLSNLIANAMEASSPKSRLKVRISRGCDWRGPNPREGVRIIVSDVGTGIPENARAGLFQPFYTTKGERGTGLGLWVSRGIVEKHEGSMRFRTSTTPGHSGTCFNIFLPAEPQFLQSVA